MNGLFIVQYFVCPIAALLFIIRLLCAPFSSRISQQMRSHPVVHVAWGCFAFVGMLILLQVIDPAASVRRSAERSKQRQEILKRVQSAGGWDEVRRGCEMLASNNPQGFYWRPPQSNVWVYPNPQTEPKKYYITNLDYGPLPPAVASLHPREIRYEPSEFFQNEKPVPHPGVVRVKFFGIHSTGGHSTPYYGLEVPYGAGAGDYLPRPSQGGVSGNRHDSFQKVADRVFEIY
jgi:hypothetical protein